MMKLEDTFKKILIGKYYDEDRTIHLEYLTSRSVKKGYVNSQKRKDK